MEKLKEILRMKASQSIAKFKVSAIAVSKKGNIIDSSFCIPSHTRKNPACHAESLLILRHGRKINKIYIMRTGNSGIRRDISPCSMCSGLAKRFGIKIIPIN